MQMMRCNVVMYISPFRQSKSLTSRYLHIPFLLSKVTQSQLASVQKCFGGQRGTTGGKVCFSEDVFDLCEDG